MLALWPLRVWDVAPDVGSHSLVALSSQPAATRQWDVAKFDIATL